MLAHLFIKTIKYYHMNITITKLTFNHGLTLPYYLLLLFLFACFSAVAQPGNDECIDAIELNAGAALVYNDYANIDATSSSGTPVSECVSSPKSDVWFKVMVPSTGTLKIQGETYNTWEIVLSVYSGQCGSLIYYDCEETIGSGIPSTISILNDALKGDYVYIHVSNIATNKEAVFQLGAYIDEVPTNDTSAGAILLENNESTFTYTTYDSKNSNGSSNQADPLCGFYLGADVWFKSIIPPSGKLVVSARNGSIIPAFVIYKGTADNLIYYNCYSGNSTTEVILDAIPVNEEIFIRVFGLNDANGGTFDLLVLEPTQDICSEAILLDGSATTENFVPYTNKYTNELTLGDIPTCGFYEGSDIWFKINMPASGELIIDSRVWTSSSIEPVLTVYTGTCGDLEEYACDFFGSDNSFAAKIEINDVGLAGEDIFLRMYSFDTDIGGAFDLFYP